MNKMKILTTCIAFLLFFASPTAIGGETTTEILPGVKLFIESGKELSLIYAPKAGEGYLTLAEKFTAGSETWKELKEINGDAILLAGKEYSVPYRLLRDEYKYLSIVSLFPEDRFQEGFWLHYPSKSALETYGEGLWQVSEWLTGNGENFHELMKINKVTDPASISGMCIRIPERLLLPVFSRPPSSDSEELIFGRDSDGEYAGYRLKKGEAIYTSVVIRFTGMTEVDDVNKLADIVARRSKIRDVKDIPVGHLIKIPVDHLLPEYLPKSDPRRIAYELENYEAEKYRMKFVAKKLDGVFLILDAGHGGVDLGTVSHGVWEHDYVYDIMCRIKRKIENETAAIVLPTIEDKKTRFAVSDAKNLAQNKQGHILTTPPFLARANSDTRMAVNLRWYLANSLRKKLVSRGVDEERIVFASIHADSLHPALRGAMVYYPGSRYISNKYGNGRSKAYRAFEEVREKPYATFTKKQKMKSEGLSKAFGSRVISSFKKEGLPVHEYLPMRNRIRRYRKEWVPAVLKGNEVPIKILLEVVNLSNKEDARIIKDPVFREQVASAFVQALIDFYDEG